MRTEDRKGRATRETHRVAVATPRGIDRASSRVEVHDALRAWNGLNHSGVDFECPSFVDLPRRTESSVRVDERCPLTRECFGVAISSPKGLEHPT